MLLWLSAHAKANKDQLLIETVQRAKAMGDDFLLDGARLYAATSAQLVILGAGGDAALADDWELLQFSWKAAVDCKPSLVACTTLPRPLPRSPNSPAAPPHLSTSHRHAPQHHW